MDKKQATPIITYIQIQKPILSLGLANIVTLSTVSSQLECYYPPEPPLKKEKDET